MTKIIYAIEDSFEYDATLGIWSEIAAAIAFLAVIGSSLYWLVF